MSDEAVSSSKQGSLEEAIARSATASDEETDGLERLDLLLARGDVALEMAREMVEDMRAFLADRPD